MAVRRLRPRRRARCGNVHPHRDRQAQRSRPAGLARRCACPHCRVAAHAGARAVALERESRPEPDPGRIGRRLTLRLRSRLLRGSGPHVLRYSPEAYGKGAETPSLIEDMRARVALLFDAWAVGMVRDGRRGELRDILAARIGATEAERVVENIAAPADVPTPPQAPEPERNLPSRMSRRGRGRCSSRHAGRGAVIGSNRRPHRDRVRGVAARPAPRPRRCRAGCLAAGDPRR